MDGIPERPVPDKCPHCGGRHYSWSVQANCEWESHKARWRAEVQGERNAIRLADALVQGLAVAVDLQELRRLKDAAVAAVGFMPAFVNYTAAFYSYAGRMQTKCKSHAEKDFLDSQLQPLLDEMAALGGVSQ